MALSYRFKDPSRTFTPNGRPRNKPVKVVMQLASHSSVRCGGNTDNLVILERPSKKSLTSHNIGLQDCMESRPPLCLDMSGPTPCTYTTTSHRNIASGIRINPRTKYKRDSLPYPNTQVWTYNVSLSNTSPTPCSYSPLGMIGSCCPTKRDSPAFTMQSRADVSLGETGASTKPGPNSYDSGEAMDATKRRFPSYTMSAASSSYRKNQSLTPGPAHYRPNYGCTKRRSPSFTMRSSNIIRTNTF